MKYFKHACNASDREFLQAVLERFGPEGYVLWFQILETMGLEMEKSIENFRRGRSNHIRARMTVGMSFLIKRAKMCRCEKSCPEVLLSFQIVPNRGESFQTVSNRAPACPERLQEFVKFAQKKGKYTGVRVRKERDEITIECPNFLDNMDEYTRKSIKEVCDKRGITPESVLTVSGHYPERILLIQQQQQDSPPLTLPRTRRARKRPVSKTDTQGTEKTGDEAGAVVAVVPERKEESPKTEERPQPDERVLKHRSTRLATPILEALGMDSTIASTLASSHPTIRILHVCEQAKRQQNPGGWARSALEKGWTVPDSNGDGLAMLTAAIEAELNAKDQYWTKAGKVLGKRPPDYPTRAEGEDEATYMARVNDWMKSKKGGAQ